MKRIVLIVAAIGLLTACNVPTTGPSVIGSGGGSGLATSSVITVVPAGTTSPFITGGTLPVIPSPELPTPLPTLASESLTPTQLKYRILDQYPDFFFCDPDYYPIARGDVAELAKERFPLLQNNQEEFQAILAHNGLSGQSSFTDQQKQLIYGEHKKLAALQFTVFANQYQFQITTSGDSKTSLNIQGLIDGSGHITVEQQTAGFASCPICLAAHTRIDTPNGPVFVEDVHPGETVWTVNALGQRTAAPVIKLARVPVSAGHILLHVVLADGRQLWASPGHPTASGSPLALLQPGDLLDGARIVTIEQFPYEGSATYDLLPAGPTGTYWANGILMGSTLHP